MVVGHTGKLGAIVRKPVEEVIENEHVIVIILFLNRVVNLARLMDQATVKLLNANTFPVRVLQLSMFYQYVLFEILARS